MENTQYEIHDTTSVYDPQWRNCTSEEAQEKIILASIYNDTTVEEIEKQLSAGKIISYKSQPNFYYTHGTDKIRVYRQPRPALALVRCSCGHSVPAISVMSASMGSSCPDCYDRMSE